MFNVQCSHAQPFPFTESKKKKNIEKMNFTSWEINGVSFKSNVKAITILSFSRNILLNLFSIRFYYAIPSSDLAELYIYVVLSKRKNYLNIKTVQQIDLRVIGNSYVSYFCLLFQKIINK